MRSRSAYTLIDVILVILIVFFSILLIIPLIQMVRESSRMTQCKDKLRELGQAVKSHVTINRHYPTGGWGWVWFGDADCGTGIEQPGGWCYNVLPNMDHKDIYDITKDGKKEPDRWILEKLVAKQLPEFICPSRREAKPTPLASSTVFKTKLFDLSAKTDYVINRGDFGGGYSRGPESLTDTKFKWPDPKTFTGISFPRSMVTEKDVSDGLSNTYLLGEKYVDFRHYLDGKDFGDNGCLYQGDDPDIARGTQQPPFPDDYQSKQAYFSFGSAHPSAWNMLFCDGSLRSLSYDIDPELHRKLGNRCDGQKVDLEKLGPAN